MTRLTHKQLVEALGFAQTLDDDPRWYPAEQPVQRIFYVALRHEGIEGADALQLLQTSPYRLRQVLPLLDDSDIASARVIASAIQPMTEDLAESADLIKAWCARQSVYKTIRNR
jgi:hypothetical protein